ncbi:MAG: hypothetical protein ABSG76_05065 [Xanthobacteraceae bacterium]|jgi:hypothetical protein
MRTTPTIDDHVTAELGRLTSRAKRSAPFVTSSVDLGGLHIASIDNIAEVLAVSEGEAFR